MRPRCSRWSPATTPRRPSRLDNRGRACHRDAPHEGATQRRSVAGHAPARRCHADQARVPDAGERAQALLDAQPTLSAALAVLDAPLDVHDEAALRDVREAVARAARAQQRYRCAACGFEAPQHFWQCPGCLSWDTFPAQRIEELYAYRRWRDRPRADRCEGDDAAAAFRRAASTSASAGTWPLPPTLATPPGPTMPTWPGSWSQ